MGGIAEVLTKALLVRGKQALKTGRKAVSDPTPYPVFSAKQFHKAVSNAKKENRFGAAVELKKVKDYKSTRMFMSQDRKSGFAIKDDGDLVSVFSTERGRFPSIMNEAKRFGASKLDAFDTGLAQMYGKHGFEESWRMPWNPQYAPEDWKAWMGRPDVVGMERFRAPQPRAYQGELPDSVMRRMRPLSDPRRQGIYTIPAGGILGGYLMDDENG